MKKIISFFALIISVIFVWQGINFYSVIKAPLIQEQNQAFTFVKENTNIQVIDDVDFYHGKEPFYIFKGKNDIEESVIIWVPESLDTYVIKRQDEGISLQEVFDFTERELNAKQIISIKLGMESSIPLYEIIYKDQQGRYSYYFISFKDGSYLKHYHLKV